MAFGAAVAALAVTLAFYAYALFAAEDLVGLDFASLTSVSRVEMPISPESGRFYPLGYQEYNLLDALFGKSAMIYQGFAAVELVVFLVCVYTLLDELPHLLRVSLMTLLLLVPATLMCFMGIVFPERDLLAWLAAMLVAVRAHERGGSKASLIAAIVCGQFALYYKEPAFLLIGGFAGARFAIRRSMDSAILVALSLVYVALYAIMIAPHINAPYAGINRAAPIATLIEFLRADYLLAAFLVVAALRAAWLVRSRQAPDPFWDPLAFGGLLYVAAFAKLGIVRARYVAPTDFISVLYLGWLLNKLPRPQPALFSAGLGVATAAVVLQAVEGSATFTLERKDFLHAIRPLARNIEVAQKGGQTNLFYAGAGGFQLMELQAYLQFRGASTGVSFHTRHRSDGDLCVPFRAFKCYYAAEPRRGDLVFNLPFQPPAEVAGGVVRYDDTVQRNAIDRVLASISPRVELKEAPRVRIVVAP